MDEARKKTFLCWNFPEKEQEIIVEQAFLDYFGLPQEIGQTIRLNLGNGDQDYIISAKTLTHPLLSLPYKRG